MEPSEREPGRLEPTTPDLHAASIRIVPVIMSGGSGTRLWPLSTDAKPKQFHALFSQRSLLQETLARTTVDPRLEFLPPILICNHRHGDLAMTQCQELEIDPSAIVLEPMGRNTAAVAVIAARLVASLDPSALVLLAPSDHIIADDQAFRSAVERGAAATHDRIVTFGIEPTAPETGYGYIQRGAALSEGVFEVQRFAEKPERAAAEAYLAEGGYDWNGGIFLFSPSVMLEEMAAHRPDILEAAGAALNAATPQGRFIALEETLFAAIPSESIDVAVMETTRRAAVAPCSAGWADVGSWSEFWRLSRKDVGGNVVNGRAVALDTQGSVILGDGMTVGVIGLTDVVVVASQGAVVVLPKSRAQDLKLLLQALRAIPPSATDLSETDPTRDQSDNAA